MPDYTVTLTSPEDIALDRTRTYINELRALENPPKSVASKAAIVQKVTMDQLTILWLQAKEWDRGKLQSALLEATPAQLTQIKAILGI